MKVLNFGSLNIDYVYDVEHFVERGETISSNNLQIFPGGKGLNQSIALSKAGISVYHAGIIGEDGEFLKEILEAANVNTKYLQKTKKVRTGNAIIQKDKNGDNCILLYSGSNHCITKDMVDEILNDFENGDFILLQNEINEISYIVKEAHKKGMKVILNPSPMNEKILEIPLECVDYFILNEIEAQHLVGEKKENEILLECLQKKFPNAELILTLGEDGCMYSGKEGRFEQKSYQVPVVDTTAAGDTFTGYYLAEIFRKHSVKEALKMATRASALAVMKKGASPSIPVLKEVLEFED